MSRYKTIDQLDLSKEAIAQMIDFSVLHPQSSKADIDKGIELSKKYNFKGFHTNTYWTPYCAEQLEGTGIEVGWPVCFPFGCVDTQVKVDEAKLGAKLLKGKPWVIDMVANSGLLTSGEYEAYKKDIAEIVKIAHDGGAECKAILEVQFFTDDQIKAAVELACEAGVDWVKSATGRHGGPQFQQVKIMCDYAAPDVKVKIAGTGSFWTPMITLGCFLLGVERIGTRNGPWIVDELSTDIAALIGAKK